MSQKSISTSIILTALLFSFNITFAQNILINEIAWMGTINSANHEWIELLNTTNTNISLEGYTLLIDEKEIKLKGIINAHDFYILERTSDNTLPEIKADLIYTGALKNTGAKLTLKDSHQNIIDEVDFQKGWKAGDNETKQTLEKIENTWQTSIEIGGSPKKPNIKKEKEIQKEKASSTIEIKKEEKFPLKAMLSISFISAITAVILKKELNN